jgi:DNA-binding NtrC family response regulator
MARPTDSPGFAISPEPPPSIHILIADPDPRMRESCAALLLQDGHPVSTTASLKETLDQIQRHPPDLLILDLDLEGTESQDRVLTGCQQAAPEALVLAMTRQPASETSLHALQRGAWDCVPKPFSGIQLRILVGRASHSLGLARRRRARPPLEPEIPPRHRSELDRRSTTSGNPMRLGTSPGFRATMEILERAAPTDAPIFLTGEVGTGKDQMAQWIHRMSPRHLGPLVSLISAAVPEAQLESELFGRAPGSSRGSREGRLGLLESANGGTLFLREVGEMSVATQAKLLRVIQDGVFQRLGSPETSVVNVRFIAAMSTDPEEAILNGTLRKDLFYRLRVVPIHLPALRERREDIPLLARHFLEEFWRRHRSVTLTGLPRFSDSALQALQSRPWPGNIRELQAVIEHTVVLLEPNTRVTPDRIPEVEGVRQGGDSGMDIPGDWMDAPYHEARDRMIADFERTYLRALLRRARGNTSQAARLAGVDRTTLYRLMQKHGMSREDALLNEGPPASPTPNPSGGPP